MLVFALMIGIISESIGEQVDSLKRGKSRVIESGHTLMLGWNDKSLAIIQQLALANESEGGGVVVVLSENDKEEMELTLLSAVESLQGGMKLMGTEVIFRSGNPLNEHEIRNVSVHSARSIICLSSDKCSADEADSRMVRQVLSLKGLGELNAHVVVELADGWMHALISLHSPTLDVSCCTLPPSFSLPPPPAFCLCFFLSEHHTSHSPLSTLQSTLDTRHSKPCTYCPCTSSGRA